MKLNKIMKMVVAMLLIALVAIVASQSVMAAKASDMNMSDFDIEDNSGAADSAMTIIGKIINIAQIIGMGVAIIMLIVLAIQYIAASPEGKAEIKKNATIYIVGAIILFAASGILGIIRKFAVGSIAGA